MSRRVYLSPSGGLKISKTGFDASTTAEVNLIFSTTRKHLMIVNKGAFVLSSPVVVPFTTSFPSEPLLFCGILSVSGIGYPVGTTLIYSGGVWTGFTARSVSVPAGGNPAEGLTCLWLAFAGS